MSFSQEIKDALCALGVKNKCCKAALALGMIYSRSDFENHIYKFSTDSEKCASLFSHTLRSLFGKEPTYEEYEKQNRAKEEVTCRRAVFDSELTNKLAERFPTGELNDIFSCSMCQASFARGIFLSNGSVNDPENSYHLELSVCDEGKAENIMKLLSSEGIQLKRTTRRGVGALYTKNSETIEDILTYIGASLDSIRIMDIKIVREIRNNENRKSNCDAANIYKSTGAAANVIRQISRLISDGKIEALDLPLKTTARLRVENPEMSLSELASIHEPPITKSGLFHRLAKITAYAQKCYDSNGDNR